MDLSENENPHYNLGDFYNSRRRIEGTWTITAPFVGPRHLLMSAAWFNSQPQSGRISG